MLSLFKKQQNTNAIIEEIHNSFYSEVELLLDSAKNYNNIETTKQGLIDKTERLKKLGFKNTKEIQEANNELTRIHLLKKENEKKQDLFKAINYFSFKYPQYKFITEDSIIKLCEKYNLVYGTVDKYIGTIPDYNLEQLEKFVIDKKDECYVREQMILSKFFGTRNEFMCFISYDEYEQEETLRLYREEQRKALSVTEQYHQHMIGDYFGRTIDSICGLVIVAPLKDFNMAESEISKFKLINKKMEIPDPVVLKPVYFEKKMYFLIITAWGEEAKDPLVYPEKRN